MHAIPLTSMTVEALKGVDVTPERGRTRQEHVRPRAALLALPPAYRRNADVPAEEVCDPQPNLLQANTIAFENGLELR